jgi:hypothetical protein
MDFPEGRRAISVAIVINMVEVDGSLRRRSRRIESIPLIAKNRTLDIESHCHCHEKETTSTADQLQNYLKIIVEQPSNAQDDKLCKNHLVHAPCPKCETAMTQADGQQKIIFLHITSVVIYQ